jgi:tripartite-type tricarboxylate transporter receptor subunit TctC
VFFGAILSATTAIAASAPVSFQGKTLTILISSSPGGGTDTAGRLISQFLPKYLPGNPITLVQNMPGGGGITANNHFYANAKPDGLTLLQDSSSAIGNMNRGGSRIKYDHRKSRPVGSIARGGSILMVRKDLKDSLTDPKSRKLVVGDTDGIRTWVSMTVWSAEYMNWNLRWLYGYKGSRELSLALRQGEIDLWATSNARLIADMRKEGGVDFRRISRQQASQRCFLGSLSGLGQLRGLGQVLDGAAQNPGQRDRCVARGVHENEQGRGVQISRNKILRRLLDA